MILNLRLVMANWFLFDRMRINRPVVLQFQRRIQKKPSNTTLNKYCSCDLVGALVAYGMIIALTPTVNLVDISTGEAQGRDCRELELWCAPYGSLDASQPQLAAG